MSPDVGAVRHRAALVDIADADVGAGAGAVSAAGCHNRLL
jgi:hypothetical protein